MRTNTEVLNKLINSKDYAIYKHENEIVISSYDLRLKMTLRLIAPNIMSFMGGIRSSIRCTVIDTDTDGIAYSETIHDSDELQEMESLIDKHLKQEQKDSAIKAYDKVSELIGRQA